MNAGSAPILLGSGRWANSAEFAIVPGRAAAAGVEVGLVLENGHIQKIVSTLQGSVPSVATIVTSRMYHHKS